MPTFRYYLLDRRNSIIGGDFLDSPDLNAAIVEVHLSCRTLDANRVAGFEIWQESTLLHEGICVCETTLSF